MGEKEDIAMIWCAIGDSFTYLNDHLNETGYRVKKGYITRVCEKISGITVNNMGINGSTTEDWLKVAIPKADFYTILLGTNDWHHHIPVGGTEDFKHAQKGTILGNLGDLVKRIREKASDAPVIIMNPVERGDFVCIDDPENNARGSYAPDGGQMLAAIADQIFLECRGEKIYPVDLHKRCGFLQENVVHFKRVKKDGRYQNLPYPDYVDVPYDPLNDEYPYPPEAVHMTYDGLHPSDEGSEVIAQILAETINKILGGQQD